MRNPGVKGFLLFGALWFGSFLLLRQGMDAADERLLFSALALAVVIIASYGALYFGRRAWRLADTPIARIRSAPQGYVELYGRAQLMEGPPVLAPLSHLPCVWYYYEIEERSSNGRWWPVDSGESDSLFLLDDGTGRCVINPDGAHFVKTRRDVWYASESGVRSHALWGIGAAYRHIEQRIMPGEELHAIGGFQTVGGLREAPDTHREVAELLERWKRDPQRMNLFDRRRNGWIDPDEWEAARRAAEKQVRRKQVQQALEPEVHLLADTGDPARPFIIAAFREEGRLIRYFQWRAAGCLLAAVLAAGFLLKWL
ncbi:MAG TPA: hypothetical protein PK820_13255 [Candidatus Competibacteraceae bacterium]|mgnify:CR=1 FL=1|nr:hypothetical protein [Candidatus Competibacteraceae bacterium]MCP5133675.1 hypothetical protein [Gammaproteobacteria bacterium]HPF59743.1 hypothetical protein [Candidatus Competibacteraceae bacterium]